MLTYKILKTILLIQSAEILPSPSTMMKELGWKGTYEKLKYGDKMSLKRRYVISHNSLKKFLAKRSLLDDKVRKGDVIVYLTNAMSTGWGICYIFFMWFVFS